MKALRVFFGIGAATALLGAGVAMAEIKNESIKSLRFSVDIGDNSVSLPEFVFCDLDSMGGEGAGDVCMMTPGGPSQNVLLELPVVPLPSPASAEESYTSARAAIAPVSLLQASTPPAEQPLRGYPSGTTDPSGPTDPPGTVDPIDPTDPPGPPVDPFVPPVDPTDPSPTVVPEPATLVIVGLGIGGAVVARRRRQA